MLLCQAIMVSDAALNFYCQNLWLIFRGFPIFIHFRFMGTMFTVRGCHIKWILKKISFKSKHIKKYLNQKMIWQENMIIFFKELKITKENNQMTKNMLDIVRKLRNRYRNHKEMLDMTKSKMAKELRHLVFTYWKL